MRDERFISKNTHMSLRKGGLILLYILFSIPISGRTDSKPSFENIFELKEVINLSQKDAITGILRDCQIDEEGYIWILDSIICNIKKYNKKGDFILSFGRKGEGPEEFIRPTGFFINKRKVYVTDPRAKRVSIFDKDGKFESSFKIEDGRSIKVGKDGRIIISAPWLESEKGGFCIHIYNEKGKLIKSFFPISEIVIKNQ